MKCSITNDEWAIFIEKYSPLIHYISKRINGDSAIANHEDNFSDLSLAALEAINYLCAREGKTPIEIISSDEFAPYIKTVLWHYKAKKGKFLRKRYHIRHQEPLIIGDEDSVSSSQYVEDPRDYFKGIKDYPKGLSCDARYLLEEVKNISLFKKNNSLNIREVIENTKLTKGGVDNAISNLKRCYKNEYEPDSE
jgi:hypothetical protein